MKKQQYHYRDQHANRAKKNPRQLDGDNKSNIPNGDQSSNAHQIMVCIVCFDLGGLMRSKSTKRPASRFSKMVRDLLACRETSCFTNLTFDH